MSTNLAAIKADFANQMVLRNESLPWAGAGVQFRHVSTVGAIYKAQDRQQLTNRARKRASG